MIKFIIETYSSKRDTNGNTYYCARIKSTITRNSLCVASLDYRRQALDKLCDTLGVDAFDVYQVNHVDVPKREFKQLEEQRDGVYPHMVNYDLLRNCGMYS